MTYKPREVSNPLTDERIIVSELVAELSGSSRLEVLRSLDEQRMTPSEIDYRGPIARQTASKHLNRLTELGLTRLAHEEDGYELTAGGRVVLDAFVACLERVGRDSLTYLTQSSHGLDLLDRLSESPARPVELAKNGESPSRATVQRILGRFESENWIEHTDSRYRITSDGLGVVNAYDELGMMIEQVMEKAPWFQRLDPRFGDLPVRELDDASLYVSSPENPGVFFAKALQLCDPDLDRFRVLTPIFNATLFRAYGELCESGLKGEAIVDSVLHERLIEEGKQHHLDDSNYPNFTVSKLEDSVTIGIALYDENALAVAAYNEIGEGNHIAMILSTNETLVEWGTDLFETFRERARPVIFRDFASAVY